MVFNDPFFPALFEFFQFHANKRTNRQVADSIEKNHRHETAQGLQETGVIIIGYYRAVRITHASGRVMHSIIIKFIFTRLSDKHQVPGGVTQSGFEQKFLESTAY